MSKSEVEQQMREDASRADALRAEARVLLAGAVRSGVAAGLSQREIAAAVGRSQPEVSRLARFQGHTPIGRQLVRKRGEVMRAIKAVGGKDVRVFGSVALGQDGPESDIDLLVELPAATSLFSLGRLESELASLLGRSVDVVPADKLHSHLSERVLNEAVPL